jgi:hypothetical protein
MSVQCGGARITERRAPQDTHPKLQPSRGLFQHFWHFCVFFFAICLEIEQNAPSSYFFDAQTVSKKSIGLKCDAL